VVRPVALLCTRNSNVLSNECVEYKSSLGEPMQRDRRWNATARTGSEWGCRYHCILLLGRGRRSVAPPPSLRIVTVVRHSAAALVYVST
jgi:hypothetical protein